MLKLSKILFIGAVACLCLAIAAVAQEAPAAGERSGGMGIMGAGRGAAPGRGMMMGGGRGGVRSPEVSSDNKVTFRFSAPDAKSVSIRGDQGSLATSTEMTKDENGVWSVTVGPLESEMYGYTFNVDGASVWDPANMQLKRDGTRITSVLIVPGGNGDLYSVKDVPHGTLAQVWYESPTLNLKQRRVYVYTPPGYETSGERYPVLYLLHGAGGDEDAWTSLGRVPQILDNLIAAGKCKPMLVVMTNGNANQTASQDIVPAAVRGGIGAARGDVAAAAGERGTVGATRDERGVAAPAAGAARGRGGIGGGAFPESIVKDVVPFIEKSYRVKANQENRAIAGLSMGGMHTHTVTLAHPETFSYYGLLSGGTYTPEELTAHKANLKLVFLSCGEKENPDGVKNATGALTAAGFNAVSYVSPGSAHEWVTWRRSLIELAPLLFK